MDSWQAHLKFGVLFTISSVLTALYYVGWKLPIKSYFWLVIVFLISPLIMDLDLRVSYLREKITMVLLLLGMGMLIVYYITGSYLHIAIGFFIASAVVFGIRYTTKHRGWMHSITFVFIWGLFLLILTQSRLVAYIGIIGAYSHLFADKIPFKII